MIASQPQCRELNHQHINFKLTPQLLILYKLIFSFDVSGQLDESEWKGRPDGRTDDSPVTY